MSKNHFPHLVKVLEHWLGFQAHPATIFNYLNDGKCELINLNVIGEPVMVCTHNGVDYVLVNHRSGKEWHYKAGVIFNSILVEPQGES